MSSQDRWESPILRPLSVFQSLLPSQNLHWEKFCALSLVGLNEGVMTLRMTEAGTLALETPDLPQGAEKPPPVGPSSHRETMA